MSTPRRLPLPRPAFPHTIMEFQSRFGTEEACREFLRASRWPDGFRCPRCGSADERTVGARLVVRCGHCRHQVSLTAGTALEGTRTPITVWFWAAYLVTTFTPGISALQLQRQTGLPRYETAFQMLHKLRAAMVRPGRDRIGGPGCVVEADEAYVGGRPRRGEVDRPNHRVLVAAAVEVILPDSPDQESYAGRVRLAQVPNRSGAALIPFVAGSILPGTILRTDGWTSYLPARHLGYLPEPHRQVNPKNASKTMPHVHRVFSNLKGWLRGTHHGVSEKHLQAYLNEFTFRFNRRGVPMAAFQTLLGLSGLVEAPTYDGLYATNERDGWVHPAPVTDFDPLAGDPGPQEEPA